MSDPASSIHWFWQRQAQRNAEEEGDYMAFEQLVAEAAAKKESKKKSKDKKSDSSKTSTSNSDPAAAAAAAAAATAADVPNVPREKGI